MNTLNSEKQEQIKELLEKGIELKEIASRVGCSESTVRRYRQKFLPATTSGKPTFKANMIKALEDKQVINFLDLARSERDLAEMGTYAGAIIGSMFDDISNAFNRNIPYAVRLAKGMRGASTFISVLAGAYEVWEQIKEKRQKKEDGI